MMGICIISLMISIVFNCFARSYKHELWRNELSQRQREQVGKVTLREMRTIGESFMANNEMNVIYVSDYDTFQ